MTRPVKSVTYGLSRRQHHACPNETMMMMAWKRTTGCRKTMWGDNMVRNKQYIGRVAGVCQHTLTDNTLHHPSKHIEQYAYIYSAITIHHR